MSGDAETGLSPYAPLGTRGGACVAHPGPSTPRGMDTGGREGILVLGGVSGTCGDSIGPACVVCGGGGGVGVGMTPGCAAVCSWRRLMASRHLPLPFP